MKVILRVIFIHESMGWIIQLNITFVAKCQEERSSLPKTRLRDCPQTEYSTHDRPVSFSNKLNFFAKLNTDGILVYR